MKLETNKEYSLKLGEAKPERAIYLGIKRFNRANAKHVFISYNQEKRNFRVYVGDLRKVTFDGEIVHMKFPHKRKIRPLEIRLLEPLFKRLEKQ